MKLIEAVRFSVYTLVSMMIGAILILNLVIQHHHRCSTSTSTVSSSGDVWTGSENNPDHRHKDAPVTLKWYRVNP